MTTPADARVLANGLRALTLAPSITAADAIVTVADVLAERVEGFSASAFVTACGLSPEDTAIYGDDLDEVAR